MLGGWLCWAALARWLVRVDVVCVYYSVGSVGGWFWLYM